jgi:hypothetical protein
MAPKPAKQIGGDHYSSHDGLQPIELIEAMSLGFHAGNALKYVARFPQTQNIADLKKAIWYIERLIQLQEPVDTAGVASQCGPQCDAGHTFFPGKCLEVDKIVAKDSRAIQVTVNECGDDASAARRFAGYIVRLQKELEAMGYRMPRNTSVDEAPIEAALLIAQNCRHQHQIQDPF